MAVFTLKSADGRTHAHTHTHACFYRELRKSNIKQNQFLSSRTQKKVGRGTQMGSGTRQYAQTVKAGASTLTSPDAANGE